MEAIKAAIGRRPENTDALTRLTLDLIREQDALCDIASKIAAMEALAANPIAKSTLGNIAADAELLARRLEPLRTYAWCELKRLGRGGQGSDEA